MKVQMNDIYKSFGKNHVLKGVDFSIESGDIHALVGENGAGKSTLMNILSGILPMDKGEIIIDGKKANISNQDISKSYGISFIHQELIDFPDLKVYENIFMNQEIKTGFFLDFKKMKEECKKLFQRLDIDIDPDTYVRDLSVGQRQMMEIAKANLREVKLLILDEPTSALTNNEIEKLFSLMAKLKNEKVAMIYISHRMEEIFALSNKISVMRDGKSVALLDTDKTDENEVVSLMVGRDIGDFYPEINNKPGSYILELKDFSRKDYFNNINIKQLT